MAISAACLHSLIPWTIIATLALTGYSFPLKQADISHESLLFGKVVSTANANHGPLMETVLPDDLFEAISSVGLIGATEIMKDAAIAGPVVRAMSDGAVLNTDFADPSLLEVDGTWHSFATGVRRNRTGYRIQAASSPDFSTWSLSDRDALAFTAPWVNTTSPQFWAPDVSRLDDGTFIMYYAARATHGPHCIGAALSPSITTPFTPLSSPLLCPVTSGGAIDASAFRDTNGDRYIVYKIDGNTLGHGGSCGNTVAPQSPTPILLQRVEHDGVTPIGDATTLLDHEPGSPLVEAPSLMLKDGVYTLLFSSNCWSTAEYDVGIAVATEITGPYARAGRLLRTGDLVPGIGDGEFLRAPGGASVAADGRHVVFHAVSGRHRSLFTAEVDMSGLEFGT